MAKVHVTTTQDITNHVFWILLLQGISLILLGILIVLYPAILIALVAAVFIWLGATTVFLAWRVHTFKGVLPGLFE